MNWIMDKRIALVTGGSQGIGRCLCIKLTDEGYEVFSASRSKSLPEDMAGITQIPVDFSSTDQTINFAKDFIDQYGVPDLLVNNAGYGAFYEWGEYPDSEITKQFDVLLSSPIRLCRIFAPAMQKKGRGVILNVSSLATLFPLPFMPMYNAAKSALSSFTASMILEYQKFPKFIDFRMGDVETDFNRSASTQAELSGASKNAWEKIEKQLENSICPEQATDQILYRIRQNREGTFFGGTWFHAFFLPYIYRFFPSSLRTFFLRLWYR